MVSGHPNTKNQSGSATNLRVGVFVSLSSIYSVISLADVHLHYVCNRQKKVEAIFFLNHKLRLVELGQCIQFLYKPIIPSKKEINSKMLKVRAADFS